MTKCNRCGQQARVMALVDDVAFCFSCFKLERITLYQDFLKALKAKEAGTPTEKIAPWVIK